MVKKSQKFFASALATTLATAGIVAPVSATGETEKTHASVVVANNVTKADTVTVKAVPAKAVVKIYNGDTVLAQKTAPSKAGDVIVTIPGGFADDVTEISITVTEPQKAESAKITVSVPKETQSKFAEATKAVTTAAADVPTTVTTGQLTLTNNVDLVDTLVVKELKAKDRIRVYDGNGTDKKLLKQAVVGSGKTEVTIALGKLTQGDQASIYVTKQSDNETESDLIQVALPKEKQSTALTAVEAVKNALTGADTVTVKGLDAKTIVNVYAITEAGAANKEVLLGKGTAKANTDLVVRTKELSDHEKVAITVKKVNENESEPFIVEVTDPKATEVTGLTVKATDNLKGRDTVVVTGVKSKDIVQVYAAKDVAEGADPEEILLGKATAKGEEVTINTQELEKYDKVFVTVTSPGDLESETRPSLKADATGYDVTHPEATVLTGITSKAFEVADENGLITLEGTDASALKEKTKVIVYSADKATIIGQGTVRRGETSITIAPTVKLAKDAKVYVSVQEDGKAASTTATDATKKYIELTVGEQPTTTAPTADKITATNYLKGADIVKVEGLTPKDVVKVYAAAEDGEPIGTATVKAGAAEVEIKLTEELASPANDDDKPSVYVTVTKEKQLESTRTAKEITQPQATVFSGTVKATDNLKGRDTVVVDGVKAKDIVQVYAAKDVAEGANPEEILLGKATAKGEEVTINTQELEKYDKVFVTVTSPGDLESETRPSLKADATGYDVTHPEATVLDGITSKAFEVAEENGLITLEGTDASALKEKTKVIVYSADKATIIGQGTMRRGETSITIAPTVKLAKDAKVYVSVQEDGKAASTTATDATKKYIELTVGEQPTTTAPTADKITATNYLKGADIVKVEGLTPKDVVKVYAAAEGGEPIGTATVKAGATEVEIKLTEELASPANDDDKPSVYVTVTKEKQLESTRTAKEITQPQATPTEGISAAIANVIKGKDTATVKGLTAKDVVYVYENVTTGEGSEAKTEKQLIGKATAQGAELVISLTKDVKGLNAETIVVNVERPTMLASDDIKPSFTDPEESTAPTEGDITIQDNVKGKDVVTVANVTAKDIVTVYGVLKEEAPAEENGDEGTGDGAVVPANAASSTEEKEEELPVIGKVTATGTTANVSINAGLDAYSAIKVTVTSPEKYESDTVEKQVTGPEKSVALTSATAENNVILADTVTVTAAAAKDIITVYADEALTTPLGKATAKAAGEVEIALTGKDAAFDNLTFTEEKSKVYVTVTSMNKLESDELAVEVAAEKASTIEADAITITNNVVEKDVIDIKGAKAKDVYKVYKDAAKTELLATTTVKAEGDFKWTLAAQLPAMAAADATEGTIFITRTAYNELESAVGTGYKYGKETVSAKLGENDVVQVNNYSGADKVTIKGLKAKDVVEIYADAAKTTLLGKVTATAEITDGHAISIASGLPAPTTAEGATASKIYVFVKRYNEQMSEALELDVAEVPESVFPGTTTEVNE